MSSGKKLRRPPPQPLTLPPIEDEWRSNPVTLQPGDIMGPPQIPPLSQHSKSFPGDIINFQTFVGESRKHDDFGITINAI